MAENLAGMMLQQVTAGKNGVLCLDETNPPSYLHIQDISHIYTANTSETVDFTGVTSIASILCPVRHYC